MLEPPAQVARLARGLAPAPERPLERGLALDDEERLDELAQVALVRARLGPARKRRGDRLDVALLLDDELARADVDDVIEPDLECAGAVLTVLDRDDGVTRRLELAYADVAGSPGCLISDFSLGFGAPSKAVRSVAIRRRSIRRSRRWRSSRTSQIDQALRRMKNVRATSALRFANLRLASSSRHRASAVRMRCRSAAALALADHAAAARCRSRQTMSAEPA